MPLSIEERYYGGPPQYGDDVVRLSLDGQRIRGRICRVVEVLDKGLVKLSDGWLVAPEFLMVVTKHYESADGGL